VNNIPTGVQTRGFGISTTPDIVPLFNPSDTELKI
jgi:hypothetical protein